MHEAYEMKAKMRDDLAEWTVGRTGSAGQSGNRGRGLRPSAFHVSDRFSVLPLDVVRVRRVDEVRVLV
jgi:hypothetical protein